MTTWPDTLPVSPLLDSFRETVSDSVIRTSMEQGPAKLRRRTTAAVRELFVSYLMSKDQVIALEAFYLTTLQGGSLSFDFTHPRIETTVSCRFVKPPEYGSGNGNFFKVTIELEVLP
ncbi:MAG: hypothetical protein KAS59_04040 [Alphaproteobacteria bacterium]|nr:hypothetical protein [Alphaproteobacteria bacterium]